MNYITQIRGFWVAQDAHSFKADEIGLYFYLLEVANKTGWKNSFKRNNSKIMVDLGIKDRRTLERHRNTLKQAGIIDFKSKNGDANVEYVLIDLSIFCTGNGSGDSSGTRSGYSLGSSTGDGTVNINQTKLNETIVLPAATDVATTEQANLFLVDPDPKPPTPPPDKKELIAKKQKEFIEQLRPYVETYGPDMINAFYRYWSEGNEKTGKIKRDLEKTWELSKRLVTWATNEQKFKK